MMQSFAVLLAALLTLSPRNTGPYLVVGLGFSPGGVSVSASVSGGVGRADVGASL